MHNNNSIRSVDNKIRDQFSKMAKVNRKTISEILRKFIEKKVKMFPIIEGSFS